MIYLMLLAGLAAAAALLLRARQREQERMERRLREYVER